MSNTRDWTWLDSATEEQTENPENEAEIKELVSQWNNLHNEEEQRYFAKDDRDDDYEDYLATMEEDQPGFIAEQKAKENVRIELYEKQMSTIENMLAERGARMCRPYEHFNEEEKYMEYMETKGDYD